MDAKAQVSPCTAQLHDSSHRAPATTCAGGGTAGSAAVHSAPGVLLCWLSSAAAPSGTETPVLQGKDKPHWSPWGDVGDVVLVKNASQVNFTGKKWTDKRYIWHTG